MSAFCDIIIPTNHDKNVCTKYTSPSLHGVTGIWQLFLGLHLLTSTTCYHKVSISTHKNEFYVGRIILTFDERLYSATTGTLTESHTDHTHLHIYNAASRFWNVARHLSAWWREALQNFRSYYIIRYGTSRFIVESCEITTATILHKSLRHNDIKWDHRSGSDQGSLPGGHKHTRSNGHLCSMRPVGI